MLCSATNRNFTKLPCHNSIFPSYLQANIAIALVRGRVYLTQDDFVSLTWLPAPKDADADLIVIGIALMYNYVAVLSASNEIYYMRADDSKLVKYTGESNPAGINHKIPSPVMLK